MSIEEKAKEYRSNLLELHLVMILQWLLMKWLNRCLKKPVDTREE